MAVNAKSAKWLLNGLMEENVEIDSEECSSGEEEEIFKIATSKPINFRNDEQDTKIGDCDDDTNYHKMKEVQTRSYQVELLKLARERNIIICLPTGSGKTYIALKLTEEMLPEAIEKNQKIVFLANNVPLVNQQAKYFSANLVCTSVKDDKYVRAISGDLNVDIWKQEQWDEIMSKYHILVMSTQIFLDALTKAYVKWGEIALCILDECHHAQKDHPMAVLMRNYGEKKAAGMTDLPKILGLTATIIKGQSKAAMIPRDIEDIEKLLCCKAVTHRDYEEVLKHSTTNIIRPVRYYLDFVRSDMVCTDITKFMELLNMLPKTFGNENELSIIESVNHHSLTSEEQIYNKYKGVPKTLHSFLNDLLKTYEELGPYCGKLAAILKLIYVMQWIQELDDFENSNSSDNTGMQPANVLTLLYTAKTAIVRFMKRLENDMEKEAKSKGLVPSSPAGEAYIVRKCISNKVTILCDILKSKGPNKNPDAESTEELCGLIFCQRRITAQVLRWYLEKASKLLPDEFGFIKPELMLGHSTNIQSTEASKFTTKRQSNIIRKFHAKELNILVATQVVEEGLNVPACNLVVRFDPILTYPSMVQSLGRARRKGAICYALIEISVEDKEVNKIESYIDYNQKLAKALERNAIHVGDDDDDDTVDDRKLIPPFCPSGDPNGPIITSTDAISLVHRYCNSLSCDKLAALVPTAWNTKSGEKIPKYKAYVLLPILSPVNQVVEGHWMPDKTLAKRSAYMEVCKKLYYADELTENLLPKPRSIDDFKCDFLDKLENEFKEESLTDKRKIGTKKRTQWIPREMPEAVRNNYIKSGSALSAYAIKIKMVQYTGEIGYESLYDFGKHKLFYGVLTKIDLSKVPKFNLLAHYGTLEVSIEKCEINGCDEIYLTKPQIKSLKAFQSFLVDSVYEISNAALQSDDDPSILIAPLLKDNDGESFTVEWELIKSLSLVNIKEYVLAEPTEIKPTRFEEAMFENTVVVPWYKKDKSVPELFCVLRALLDQNAKSPFDEPKKFSTFQEYFSKQYGIKMHHPEFPLLQCKSLGKKLNFLTSKQDGRLIRTDLLRSSVKMIPELVNIHLLPGSLLIQGRYLPSVLHRIFRLLLVNKQIREKVALRFDWNVGTGCEDDNMGNVPSSSNDRSDEGGAAANSFPLQPILSTPVEKKSKEAENEEEIILLETINPLEISWDQILKPKKNKKSIYDTKFSMPEPPTLKSGVQADLVPIWEIKFKSFDTPTNFLVHKGPNMNAIMEALTLSNAQDSVDLERLEVIGDSVLKLIVSLHIHRNFPTWDEGKMTLLRMKLISNRHLYQLGRKHGIEKLLSGSIFIPTENWLPPGFSVPQKVEEFILSKQLDYKIFQKIPSGSLNEETLQDEYNEEVIQRFLKSQRYTPHTSYTHTRIADKSVADGMEALIGAYHLNGGIDGALRVMEWLGFEGPLLSGESEVYSRQVSLSPLPSESKKLGNQNIIPLLKDLEEILCYRFRNPWLAVEALTHPTYMSNRQTSCYERLEFVGDALLDFLVTDWILNNTNIKEPGKVTDLRSALVNNVTFGSLAVRYGFHTFFKYSSETLGNYIARFVQHQEENNHEVSDPYELYSDFDCPTVREIEVPKVLGDIFESIAGAVFVDSGMSIDTVWRVFYRLMKRELEKFSRNIPKSPLRQLYELFPGKVKFKKLASDSSSNPKTKKHNNCASKFQAVFLTVPRCKSTIIGIGPTIKQAKQAAAKYVVREMKSAN